MSVLAKKAAASLAVLAVSGGILGGIVTSSVDMGSSNNNTVAVQEETKKPVIETKIETKTKEIDFEKKTVKDKNLEWGKTVVRTKGKKGVRTYKYSVTYEDGVEKSRKLLSKEVTTKPVTKIIAKGTKVLWHCQDATSYDRNPYNDNLCINSKGAKRYVSDCEARYLDRNYCPAQIGPSYYNGCSCY